MPIRRTVSRVVVAACAALALQCLPALAQEPGGNVAAPRFAICEVYDNTIFSPAFMVVEQGDWVRWRSLASGTTHTTTSGSACVGNGLWSINLSPNGQFTRQFMDTPSILSFFCIQHCSLGMMGQVKVTTPIALAVSLEGTDAILIWSGGGGKYRVFVGDTPALLGAGTSIVAPDGGDTGMMLTDPTDPALGQVRFYYVGNKP